jgi:hypothetical protein
VSRVLEIRTYRLHPGTRDAFHDLMQARCLPLLAAWDMDVVHAGPCAAEPEGYTLLRTYDDPTHLRESQDAFYGSEAWRQGPREAVLACIDTYLSVVLPVTEEAIAALRTVSREG